MLPDKSYVGPDLPEPLRDLAPLALDLRWSWNHSMDSLWESIDRDLWLATGNPWALLETVSVQRLRALAEDPVFLADLQRHSEARREAGAAASWCETCVDRQVLGRVAYFSMEFGLSEALPLYSGGLGILAGDYLKTASDLGVPVTGVGMLFQRGYFRQAIDARGRQLALYPYNDPVLMPVMPLRDESGEWLRVFLPLPGRTLMLRCWEVVVGRNVLYLLDANDPVNSPRDRGITGELYGGNIETRLQQELVLGVAGWQLMDLLAKDVRTCHLNEGHAAFATLARAASLMAAHDLDVDSALAAARSGTVFTTHTPVSAAFDRFPLALAGQYLEPLATQWHIPLDRILALGAERTSSGEARFNMAALAARTAGAINGVSSSHEAVSRTLFAPMFPRWPLSEIQVGHVTNGVHVPSWDSSAADRLWTRACGKERWRGGQEELEAFLREVPDEQLWECRCESRRHLIDELLVRQRRQAARRGQPPNGATGSGPALDPNALTIGFARRFTGYKRTNLLLREPDRLLDMMSDAARPVQLVLAGKADPRDPEGLAMIEEWTRFLRHPRLRPGSVVFVEDYDMAVAAALTAGVDVWINTPRRPWEACGTSGMKVLVNGGLNLSVLDGWWAEAYEPPLGWAIGDGRLPETGEEWDARDARSLYEVLETVVIPQFFERDESGTPRNWVARMRESMARLTPRFSGNRMLREYVEAYYLPLAKNYVARLANGGRLAKEIAGWQERTMKHLSEIRVEGPAFTAVPEGWRAGARVYLDGLRVEDVRVELYADPEQDDGNAERIVLQADDTLRGAVQGFHYEATLRTSRPLSHYTLRVRPHHEHAVVPLECPVIFWGRSGPP
ncbi:MAG: alpha-glucan family phosphorylase [Arenicellales bacterium]